MTYKDLTINQKINLKDIISNCKSRNEIYSLSPACSISDKDHKYFDGLYALAIINKNYIESINIFLKDL